MINFQFYHEKVITLFPYCTSYEFIINIKLYGKNIIIKIIFFEIILSIRCVP